MKPKVDQTRILLNKIGVSHLNIDVVSLKPVHKLFALH